MFTIFDNYTSEYAVAIVAILELLIVSYILGEHTCSHTHITHKWCRHEQVHRRTFVNDATTVVERHPLDRRSTGFLLAGNVDVCCARISGGEHGPRTSAHTPISQAIMFVSSFSPQSNAYNEYKFPYSAEQFGMFLGILPLLSIPVFAIWKVIAHCRRPKSVCSTSQTPV